MMKRERRLGAEGRRTGGAAQFVRENNKSFKGISQTVFGENAPVYHGGRGRDGRGISICRGNYTSFKGINVTLLKQCTSSSCISCNSYNQ